MGISTSIVNKSQVETLGSNQLSTNKNKNKNKNKNMKVEVINMNKLFNTKLGTNNTGALKAQSDNKLAFEAFFAGEVEIFTKLEAGKHVGTITKVEDMIKDTVQYTKLTIKLADRDIVYTVFNKDLFVLEYNLVNDTEYTAVGQLLNKPVTIYQSYTSEDDKFGIRRITPHLEAGTHSVTFQGFVLVEDIQAVVIAFEAEGETHYDIRLFTPEKQKALMTTFRFLAQALGFDKPVAFSSLNDKVGTEITVNMVKVEGYKNTFINYGQPASTLSEPDNASDDNIPQY